MTFEEWLASIEGDYPEIRLTRTKNMLREAWFASSKLYNPNKDAERYRWLKERYLGADFAYEYDGGKRHPVLLFKMLPVTMALRGYDLDATIDQAEQPREPQPREGS